VPQTAGVSMGATAFSGLLFSVSIDVQGPVLEPGAPRQIVVFPAINLPHSGGGYHPYPVDPQSGPLLVPQFSPPPTAVTGTQIRPDTFSGLTVDLNWTSALKK